MNSAHIIVLCSFVAAVGGSAPATVNPVYYANTYCYCNSTAVSTGSCTVQCSNKYTCNDNGVCSGIGGTCQCNQYFAPPWCSECLPNVRPGSTKNGTRTCGPTCNDGWYGPNCATACNAQTCNLAAGATCQPDGSCQCAKGYTGPSCSYCDYANGAFDGPVVGSNGGCYNCTPAANCSGNGYCVPGNATSLPTCNCPYPFTGAQCESCSNGQQGGTNRCGVSNSNTNAKGAAGNTACPPPNLLLPVIIAAVLSLLAIMAVIAFYFWYLGKKKESQKARRVGNTNNDDELEEEDPNGIPLAENRDPNTHSTPYSRL